MQSVEQCTSNGKVQLTLSNGDYVLTADSVDFHHKYNEMDLPSLKKLMESETVSKNQKKKIVKQIKWIESADKRREQRKERKLRYKDMRAKNINNDFVKRKKVENISTTENFDGLFHVAIDLSFEKLMTNRDLKKLGKQIAWSYKENRRSSNALQYHLCGLEGRLKASLDPSHINWDVHFNKNVFESFSAEKITYLTAESPNVLEDLQPGQVYVIGGLVDHNHQKGVCQKLAQDKNVKTAHLPLQENIDMKTRKVLTVNHVFEMLLAYCECKDWKSAILKVLPPKKLTPSNPGQTNCDNKSDCDGNELPSVALSSKYSPESDDTEIDVPFNNSNVLVP